MSRAHARRRLLLTGALLAAVSMTALGRAPVACAAEPAGRPPVRNVILLIADGWSYNDILATGYYLAGRSGAQVYEQFPVRYAVSTYPAGGSYDPVAAWTDFDYVKQGPTDSAAAATALACGVKTSNGALGVDVAGQPLVNLLERAEAVGKSTGVVTSVPLSHATPAGFVAHQASRGSYETIAQEMLLRSAMDVIMGAGHPWYDDQGVRRTEGSFGYVGGEQTWQGLESGTAGGDANGDGQADPWVLVQTRAQFQALGQGPTPARVCGVAPVGETLQERRGGDAAAAPCVVPLTSSVPTLAEMSAAALNVLDDNPRGLVLMIEGGAVDWAAHSNLSGRMIEELAGFGEAVQTVCDWVERHSTWEETLVVVTGDHETGDLNGPDSGPRWWAVINNGLGLLPSMIWCSGSHTNSLIPLFARGAGAERLADYADQTDPVRGPYLDNTEVAQVLAQATP